MSTGLTIHQINQIKAGKDPKLSIAQSENYSELIKDANNLEKKQTISDEIYSAQQLYEADKKQAEQHYQQAKNEHSKVMFEHYHGKIRILLNNKVKYLDSRIYEIRKNAALYAGLRVEELLKVKAQYKSLDLSLNQKLHTLKLQKTFQKTNFKRV